MEKTNWRQGDINIHAIDSLPEGLEEIKHKGKYIVGYGGASGHNHTLVATPTTMKIFKDTFGNIYFDFKDEVQLEHVIGDSRKIADHKPLKIKKGIYKRIQEREIDWFSEGLERKVID